MSGPYEIGSLHRRIDELDAAACELRGGQRELWDAIAELRDELHDLAQRVTTVHAELLKTLTDHYDRRNLADTRHGTDRTD